MVSNEEISQRLRNKRKGSSLNSYLVCNKCGGYYELQPGESLKDFDTKCECGGHLIQSTSKSLTSYEDEYRDYGTAIAVSYILLIFGGVPGLICGFYLLTRDSERARFHGKIIIVIGLFFTLLCIVFAVESLFIYNSYFHGPTTINPSSDIASVRPSR